MNNIAYGFMNLRDRFALFALQPQIIPIVETAIQDTLREHNRVLDAMYRLFVQPVLDPILRYRQQGQARLMPLDENGRALPMKPILSYYDVAWPLYNGAAAWGSTWMERIKWTVEDVNRNIWNLTMADINWMRDHMYSAFFQNANWIADDDERGSLTIRPLANGDAVIYQYWSAGQYGATDNHFLAQAAAISDAANPFPTIFRKITEHPTNTGAVIAFVPTNLVGDITNLSTFHTMPDPNLQYPTTVLQVTAPPPYGLSPSYAFAQGDIPGRIVGYEESKVWVIEWPTMPDDYYIAISENGDRPLGMRQEPFPELQGFRMVAEGDPNDSHPFWEQQFFRRAGFGAMNRVAAVVGTVGNATYTPPAIYATPIR